MPVVDGVKYACSRCIRGHRVSRCEHTEEELFMIKPKGRPSTHCSYCKLNRKRGVNNKCVCNGAMNESCKCGPGQKCVCGARRRRMPASLPPRTLAGLDRGPAYRTPEDEHDGYFTDPNHQLQLQNQNQNQTHISVAPQPLGIHGMPQGMPQPHLEMKQVVGPNGMLMPMPNQQIHAMPHNQYVGGYIPNSENPAEASPNVSYSYAYNDYASGAYTGYASACHGYGNQPSAEYSQMYAYPPNGMIGGAGMSASRAAMAYPSPSYETSQPTSRRNEYGQSTYMDTQQLRSMSLGTLAVETQEHKDDRRHSEPAYRHEIPSIGRYTVPMPPQSSTTHMMAAQGSQAAAAAAAAGSYSSQNTNTHYNMPHAPIMAHEMPSENTLIAAQPIS